MLIKKSLIKLVEWRGNGSAIVCPLCAKHCASKTGISFRLYEPRWSKVSIEFCSLADLRNSLSNWALLIIRLTEESWRLTKLHLLQSVPQLSSDAGISMVVVRVTTTPLLSSDAHGRCFLLDCTAWYDQFHYYSLMAGTKILLCEIVDQVYFHWLDWKFSEGRYHTCLVFWCHLTIRHIVGTQSFWMTRIDSSCNLHWFQKNLSASFFCGSFQFTVLQPALSTFPRRFNHQHQAKWSNMHPPP